MKKNKKYIIKDSIIRKKSKAIEMNLYRSLENQKYLKYMNQKKDFMRLIYGLVFLTLVLAEILIALFAHDDFVRPYVGDVLIVITVYAFIRIFIPRGNIYLPIIILLFACIVECGQYYNIVEKIGLGDVEFFRVLFGTVGDFYDIVCYAIGTIILLLYELMLLKLENKK